MEINEESMKEAIKNLKKAILEIEGLIGEKNEEIDESREYWANRLGILAEVMLEGGIVSVERWKEIAKKYDHDNRGLGGYHTGKKHSMVKLAGGKRAITEYGEDDVLDWLEGKSSTLPYPEQKERFKSLLEEQDE